VRLWRWAVDRLHPRDVEPGRGARQKSGA